MVELLHAKAKRKNEGDEDDMAGIGLKRFKYAKLNDDGKTYGTVKTLAGAIECKVTLDLAEATLYSDDALKEQVSMFKSGTLTAGIDEDDDTIFAELLGKTTAEDTGIVTSNVNDEPIFVGFGHIVPKMVSGAKKYKVEFFPKMKFKPFIVDAKTKGDNLEFTTPSVEATIFENGSQRAASSGRSRRADEQEEIQSRANGARPHRPSRERNLAG